MAVAALRWRVPLVALLVAGVAVPSTGVAYAANPAPLPPAAAAPLDPFASALLAYHNGERIRHGLAPLAWDPALATAAENYAATLAATGIFRHSERSTRVGQGENLWTGTHGAFGVSQMMQGWLGEKPLYQPGVFPNVSRTGNWAAVGHYTQVIWARTTHVGCAVRSNPGFDYLVCRYSPPGNVFGTPMS